MFSLSNGCGKFYSVEKDRVEKPHDMGVYTGADLLEIPEMTLIDLFGRFNDLTFIIGARRHQQFTSKSTVFVSLSAKERTMEVA